MTMMPDILLVERVSQTQVLGTQRKGNMCLRQEVAPDWNIILFIWFFFVKLVFSLSEKLSYSIKFIFYMY